MKKYLILIVIINIIFSIFFVFSDKEIFSENENRNLTTLKNYSVDDIIDGSASKNVDSYINDHFPFRDLFLSMNSYIKILLGNKKINDVYINDNDLFLEYKGSDVEKITDSLNKFYKKNDIKLSLILVPSSSLVNKDKLPKYVDTTNEEEDLKYFSNNLDFKFINGYNVLKDKENVYYKLDHHYNLFGSYEIYKEFCKLNNLESKDIKFDLLTNEFRGTLYSKVHLFNKQKEKMYYYKYNNDVRLINNTTITNTLYDESYIDKKDKYSFYLGGNYPLLKIESDNNTDKEILIIKDSYANSFIPFLTDNYSNIHVIDKRFYNLSITDYIKDNNIKEVLLLYSISSLGESNIENIN